MEERCYGVQAWIDRLNDSELPALAAVVTDMQQLAESESSSVQELASVLLRDASLTSKVLRVANSSYYNPACEGIRTIARAIVLSGCDSMRLIRLSVSLVDGRLSRGQRDQVPELLASSFHAAVQARNIAGYVFVGVLVGISFFLLNNVFGFVGNLRNWEPWLAAAAPGIIYSLLSLGAFGWLVLRQ